MHTEVLVRVAVEDVPPAVSFAPATVASWTIAIVVLVSSCIVVLIMSRREAARMARLKLTAATAATAATVATAATSTTPTTPSSPATANFNALETVGEAMVDAGYTVMAVHSALEDIARANGYPRTEIVVLPTALFVSARSTGELHTGVVSSGHTPLLLHQLDDLDRIVEQARSGRLTAVRARALIRMMRVTRPPNPIGVRIIAYVFLCAALAVLLGGSWTSVVVASLLGAVVGATMLLTAGLSRIHAPLLTVGLSFTCAVVVFLLAHLGLDPGLLPSLIAPLIVLLPGGLLTTGIIELATVQMVSGASRVAAGFMQLLLLAAGIVAGATLVGVPYIKLTEAYDSLGPIAPWIAVAVFGAAVVIYRGGRASSIGWITLVLYVAYSAQVLGDVFFGGVISAFVGAFAMTPVASSVSRLPTGPAAPVTFLPGFWMLVPGAIGLVGVTTLLDGDGTGASTIVTTVFTMVAIALGVLAGSALTGGLKSPRTLI